VDAQRSRDWPWVLTLLLLASVFGETIASASTPPVAYVRSPLTLPFLVVGYGCWALLFREAWARGRLSWAGGALAGIGYAAFNEGLVAHTWFRPSLNGFSAFRLGRIAGVNWCVVVGLCAYHAIFSMAMPIVLVQLRRAEPYPRPWVGRRGLVIAGATVLLLIIGLILGQGIATRSPDRLIAGVVGVVLPLVAVVIGRARRPGFSPVRDALPRRRASSAPAGDGVLRGRTVRRRGAYGFGLGWALAFYLSYYGLPALIGILAVAAEAAVAGAAVGYLRSRPARLDWSASHWVALIGGALTPALLFDAFQVTSLETLAVLGAALCLLRLSRRVDPINGKRKPGTGRSRRSGGGCGTPPPARTTGRTGRLPSRRRSSTGAAPG
jgi:hypothetical protein